MNFSWFGRMRKASKDIRKGKIEKNLNIWPLFLQPLETFCLSNISLSFPHLVSISIITYSFCELDFGQEILQRRMKPILNSIQRPSSFQILAQVLLRLNLLSVT